MSGTRVLFSQVIPKLRANEAQWLIRYIEARHRGRDLQGAPKNYDENGFFPEFKFAIKEAETDLGLYAWFYTDGNENNASVFQVAEVAQEFLCRFRRNDCFVLTWAETDPNLRVSHFDGGALFVTAEDIEAFHAGEWAHQKERAFLERVPRTRRRIVSASTL